MGQKIHPVGLRLGITRTWDSRWFEKKHYRAWLHEDVAIRKYFGRMTRAAAISKSRSSAVPIRRASSSTPAKPGIIIGKRGVGIDEIRKNLEKLTGKEVQVNVVEIKHPELDSRLVGQNIVDQLEKRIAFRRAMKQAIMRTMKAGARGVKVQVSGRLGGAEIARTERNHDGKVPLHTLRADIDYAHVEAFTTFGRIGVKVWIYKGEVLPDQPRGETHRAERARPASARPSATGAASAAAAAAAPADGAQPRNARRRDRGAPAEPRRTARLRTRAGRRDRRLHAQHDVTRVEADGAPSATGFHQTSEHGGGRGARRRSRARSRRDRRNVRRPPDASDGRRGRTSREPSTAPTAFEPAGPRRTPIVPSSRPRRAVSNVDAQTRQVAPRAPRPHEGPRARRQHADLRRLRAAGARAGLDDQPADRSGAYRDDASYQARR